MEAKSNLTTWAKFGGHELFKNIEEGVLKFWIKKIKTRQFRGVL